MVKFCLTCRDRVRASVEVSKLAAVAVAALMPVWRSCHRVSSSTSPIMASISSVVAVPTSRPRRKASPLEVSGLSSWSSKKRPEFPEGLFRFDGVAQVADGAKR